MRKLKVNTKANRTDTEQVASAIEARREIDGSNFRGEAARSGHLSSYLSGNALLMLKAHNEFFHDTAGVEYVIYSYATPIGWIYRRTDGTEAFYLVRGKFSPTTSGHQTYLGAIARDYERLNGAEIIYVDNK